jgi:hypothetical protein
MMKAPANRLFQGIATSPNGRMSRYLHRLIFGRGFSGDRPNQLLVLFLPDRIPYASAYPFLWYAESFAEKFDAEIRFFPVEEAVAHGLPPGLRHPTHVLAQASLLAPPEKHLALARFLGTMPEGTVKAFSDTYANADIRLSSALPDIDLYFKKSLFVDRHEFLRPTYGHTNLTEYYGRLYGIEDQITDWRIPENVLGKLRLAPNFLTDPRLLHTLLDSRGLPPLTGRTIDLHSRLGGTDRSGWYGEMRRHASRVAEGLAGVTVASGADVDRRAFMSELRRSKICFSPFGYGELCWRDIEAIAAGAVLLKPDMSHLSTAPDLFRNDETYVACRWDFSDVAEMVRDLIDNEERRKRIATAAWKTARDYLVNDGPVLTYGGIFER